MKGKSFIVIGIVLICVGCAAGGLYYFENYEKTYYSKIDNTRVTELQTSDSMRYLYTLDCYDESGKKKELKFKTSRVLKEGAYILLDVRLLGVHRWAEVQYYELPQPVQHVIR